MQTKTTFKFLGATLLSLILMGCGGGDDSVLDNRLNGVSSSNTNSSASSSVIGADTLQTLEFKDTTPSVINLIGTGGKESSLVRFRTLGQTGSPMSGIEVDFTLTSSVGGLRLSQTSGKSDKDGYVSTSVISGTVSTSIKVTATVKDTPAISAQSNQLVIATGLPDQKSMSISLEIFNPAGWDHDGITSKVSILLADAYNNPAADGTVVSFKTEGGSILPSCTTTGGGCSVLWKSQDNRPPRTNPDNSVSRKLCLDITDETLLHTCQAERAGRSTILATVIGNESFKDTNGNGVFDPSVDKFASPNFFLDKNENGVLDSEDELVSPKEPRPAKAIDVNECKRNTPYSSFESTTEQCDDLGEAYLDSNESKTFNSDQDLLSDFLVDAAYTPRNGIYNGAFCQTMDETKGYCSRTPVEIRKDHLVIMSCDTPLLDNGYLPKVSDNIYAAADCNGNALPTGTTITVGNNPAITIGNEYNWRPIFTGPGIPVKLSIKAGSTVDITVTGN